MPSQSKIINSVNGCLKNSHPNIEFELNNSGVCAGLSGLYIKYALEHKTKKFFSILNSLGALPDNYAFGNNPRIDEFIPQLDRVFRPDLYNCYDYLQGDFNQVKVIDIQQKPLRNEFNFGIMADEEQWASIFEQIALENRAYYVTSTNHAIALFVQNRRFFFYDPNNESEVIFDSVKQVIAKFKLCFAYKDKYFGLSIRAFAHPDVKPEEYPEHTTLHQLTTVKQDDQSAVFAASACDIKTLSHLVAQIPAYLLSIGFYYIRPELVDFLLKQNNSTEVARALLTSICVNISRGHIKACKKLTEHYLVQYNSARDQEELKQWLQQTLSHSVRKLKNLMNKRPNDDRDLNWVLKLYKDNSLNQLGIYQDNYNYLKLLTLLDIDTKNVLKSWLANLPAAQLITQIQYAAELNQSSVLDSLFVHVLETPSKIDKELILNGVFKKISFEHMNVLTLNKLLNKSFIVDLNDQKIITQCMQRNDKSLFKKILEAWLKQNNQANLWNTNNLSIRIGAISVLESWAFLRKDNLIERSWNDNIHEDLIKNALIIAIQDDNLNLSLFLQKQLSKKHCFLDADILKEFYEQGLMNRNFTKLAIIAQLGYKLLDIKEDINKILSICSMNDDFSPIITSFKTTDQERKRLILERSLEFNYSTFVTYCAKNHPELFNEILNNSLQQNITLQENKMLKRLDRAIKRLNLGPSTCSLNLEKSQQKSFIKYIFEQNYYSLAQYLSPILQWNDEDLAEIVREFITQKNDYALLTLMFIVPELTDKMNEFVDELLEQNLLNSVQHLYTNTTFSEEILNKLLVSAIKMNHKGLITEFLKKNLINISTPPLLPLLEEAITQGHYEVVEAFIENESDINLDDFKSLFLISCKNKQLKIANLLLAKEFKLSDDEISAKVADLFGTYSESDPFEICYQNGYGRLYRILYKAGIRNPREELLHSIKNPTQDSKFQKTNIYLQPLRRSIQEKNKKIFDKFIGELNLFPNIDDELLSFLEDPITTPIVLSIFIKKFGLNNLLDKAIVSKKWAVVANLIEKSKHNDLEDELLQTIREHGDLIINAFIENLENNYVKADVRRRLFNLLSKSDELILSQLATQFHQVIYEKLNTIELGMIEKGIDLDGHIYRHQFEPAKLNNVLGEVTRAFIKIRELNINLDQPLKDQEVIDTFCTIKNVLTGNESIYNIILKDDNDLLNQLLDNPRLKDVCQLEFDLYLLLKDKENNREKCIELINQLQTALEIAELDTSFLITSIQEYIKNIEKSKNEEKHSTQLPPPVAAKPTVTPTPVAVNPTVAPTPVVTKPTINPEYDKILEELEQMTREQENQRINDANKKSEEPAKDKEPPNPEVRKSQSEEKQIRQLNKICKEYLTHLNNKSIYKDDKITRDKTQVVNGLILALNEHSVEQFANFFNQNKRVIEKNRDSYGAYFIKCVITVLSAGIAVAFGLWNVKGEDVNKQINDTLGTSSKLSPRDSM